MGKFAHTCVVNCNTFFRLRPLEESIALARCTGLLCLHPGNLTKRLLPARRPDDFQFQPREPRHLLKLAQEVPDAQCAMVGRSLAAIGIDEGCGFKRESQPAVGVADLQPLTGEAFALRREKFQPAIAGLGERRGW